MKLRARGETCNRGVPAVVSDSFRRATAFGRKPCISWPALEFAPDQPDSRYAPNTSEWCGESRFVWQLPPATTPFPGAESATTHHRSCGELLVFDPFTDEHTHGEWPTVVFDNTPSILQMFFTCHRDENFGR